MSTSFWLATTAGAAALLGLASPLVAEEFEAPVRLMSNGAPVDVEIGHAAPYLYDFDCDGNRDLLVGQFGGGKLRIYKNTGTNQAPVYGASEWLTANGTVVTTPVG